MRWKRIVLCCVGIVLVGAAGTGVVSRLLPEESNAVFRAEDTGSVDNEAKITEATQRQLRETLYTLEEVERSTVTITGGELPSASVQIRLAPGAELSPERRESIRNLVAASVAELSEDNLILTITNSAETKE